MQLKKFESKINGKGVVKAPIGFILFTLNEDINDIIKIIKPFKDSGRSIEGVTETVKHEIKNKKVDFLKHC